MKTELPYDTAVPLRDSYSKELKSGSQRDTGMLMLIATSRTTVKLWKQSKCSLMDEWIK